MKTRRILALLFGAFMMELSVPCSSNAQNREKQERFYLTPNNILISLARDKIFHKHDNSLGIGWSPVKYGDLGLYLMANSSVSSSNDISSMRPGIEFGLMYKVKVLNNEIYFGAGYLIEFKTREEKMIDDFFRNYREDKKTMPNIGNGLEGFVIQFGTSLYISNK